MTPDTHSILYTRKSDDGVSICIPAPEMIHWMSSGGYWSDRPRGFLKEIVRRKTCPTLQKGAPLSEGSAWAFVNALQWGGCTTQEAWNVIRLHDVDRYGLDALVIRKDELPDRWFRDAWTRKGSNSGLPYVDLELARPIQWKRIHAAVSRENKRRAADLFGKPEIKLNKAQYQTAIKHARDADELRKIWEPSLPR